MDCLELLQEAIDNEDLDMPLRIQAARDLAKYKHRPLRPKEDIDPNEAPSLTVVLTGQQKAKTICLRPT